ncbi:MAG: MFS transporter [Lentisphaerae bacterium]|nr:MFS transporter [Lentisphaerota bacterium]
MSAAEQYSPQQRKKFQRTAILSAWFGCVSEQLLDSNSMIILYLITLGGDESFSMFSTAISAICGIFMNIICAGIISKTGLRASYSTAVFGSAGAFLLMAAAPSIVPIEYAKYLVIAGCIIYCLLRAPYSVAWYPMLDMILAPDERGGFFGIMRFSYILINACILYLIGKILGTAPAIHTMQIIIAVAGLCMLGRKICMDKMPDNPEVKQNKLDIKKSLNISVHNAPLVGFSFYSCFFNIATASIMPLAVIYIKTRLNFSAEAVMTSTSLYMVGMVCGYAASGKLMNRIGHRYFQILTHSVYVAVLGVLTMVHPATPYSHIIITILFWCLGTGGAFFSCLNSTEMLAAAKPGNKIMGMAFCQTFTNMGAAIGRLGTTLVLAAGVLMPDWKFFGINMSCYNFMFMFCFIMMVFFYLLLLLSPAVIAKHDDYYEP